VSLNGSTNEIGLRAALPAGSQGFYRSLYIHFVLGAHHESKRLTLRGKTANSLSIRTNLDIAAKLRIPKGSGLFLLNRQTDGVEGKRFGVLIEPP